MKFISRSVILCSIFALSFCFFPLVNQAQVGGPPCTGDPGDPCDVDTPIDGGLGLLIAVGVCYGIKKLRDEQENTANKLL